MLILALDTTNENGGVGLFRDQECLALVANEGPANIYSISLFEMVNRAVEEAGAFCTHSGESGAPHSLHDVELFAVANGPGSFTGIRVGLAAAQGWAKALGRPVRGVSVLEALVSEAHPHAEWAVPILDARRGEYYLGIFHRVPKPDSIPGRFEAQGDGWLLKPRELKSFLRDRLPADATAVFLAREHDQQALALHERLADSFKWQSVPGTLMGAIARQALAANREENRQLPTGLDALYIRRPDAELKE
jgi:tRNA threonylcarbamoyl adenosine modification protein YeaZ